MMFTIAFALFAAAFLILGIYEWIEYPHLAVKPVEALVAIWQAAVFAGLIMLVRLCLLLWLPPDSHDDFLPNQIVGLMEEVKEKLRENAKKLAKASDEHAEENGDSPEKSTRGLFSISNELDLQDGESSDKTNGYSIDDQRRSSIVKCLHRLSLAYSHPYETDTPPQNLSSSSDTIIPRTRSSAPSPESEVGKTDLATLDLPSPPTANPPPSPSRTTPPPPSARTSLLITPFHSIFKKDHQNPSTDPLEKVRPADIYIPTRMEGWTRGPSIDGHTSGLLSPSPVKRSQLQDLERWKPSSEPNMGMTIFKEYTGVAIKPPKFEGKRSI